MALTEQGGGAHGAGPADPGAHIGVPAMTATPIDIDVQRTLNRTAGVPDDKRARLACIAGTNYVVTDAGAGARAMDAHEAARCSTIGTTETGQRPFFPILAWGPAW